MIDKLNSYHLEYIPTSELKNLKRDIVIELEKRRLDLKKKARLSEHVQVEFLPPVKYEANDEIEKHNSSNLYSIPNHYARKTTNNIIYLQSLLDQDWSHIYYGGDVSQKYYVYAHVNPNGTILQLPKSCGGNYGGQPFYIGKGIDNRAYDLKRNQGHGKVLNNLLHEGYKPCDIVRILFNNLTEAKAYEIEAKLIYFLGTIYDKKLKKKGWLYNLNIPKLPEFISEMKQYIKIDNPYSLIKNQQQNKAAEIRELL